MTSTQKGWDNYTAWLQSKEYQRWHNCKKCKYSECKKRNEKAICSRIGASNNKEYGK